MQDCRSVAFSSHALTNMETRYAQIEKEILAVVPAYTKLKDFVSGKSTMVETDN
jgi:hypothetical protein